MKPRLSVVELRLELLVSSVVVFVVMTQVTELRMEVVKLNEPERDAILRLAQLNLLCGEAMLPLYGLGLGLTLVRV
ncbi:MAG TPA: hypothetical protein VNU46_05440 [Gemmatimonadaceae bacterium]|nr:hypothetical protein [Gemmatimonadaceae bacterium]